MTTTLENLLTSLLPIAHAKFFVAMLGVKIIAQNYLDLRQRRHIQANRSTVPADFAHAINAEEHETSASYTLERMQLVKMMRSLNLVVLLLWTLGGGIERTTQLIAGLTGGESPLWDGLILFAAYGLVSYLLMLPASIYSTFVLEQKYGLNNTSWKTFISDNAKQLLLSALLAMPILLLVLWFMHTIPIWWPYAFAALALFQLLMILIYPTLIAPLFNKFSPMQEGEMKQEAERLLQDVAFDAKELLVMDASRRSNHGNAYFTGLGKSRRIVFYDTLLKQLTPQEMRAILAHEIGHFKLKHIMKHISVSLVMSLIGLFVLWSLAQWPAFFQMHGVQTMGHAQALLLFTLVGGTYTFLLTPLSSLMSRKHEYQADAFASRHARADDLVSALLKLYRNNVSFLTSDSFYATFYFSHPSAPERVAHLKSLPKNQDTANTP